MMDAQSKYYCILGACFVGTYQCSTYIEDIIHSGLVWKRKKGGSTVSSREEG